MELVELALFAFVHAHRDPPAPRDHRLAGSLRARAAADESFPDANSSPASSPAAKPSPTRSLSSSPSPTRVATSSPRRGSPGSPSFSASGTTLSPAAAPRTTGSRTDFLLTNLSELLALAAATAAGAAEGQEGRLSRCGPLSRRRL